MNAALVRTLREAGARALLVDVYHLDRGAGPDDLVGRTLTTKEQEAELEVEAGMAEDYAAELLQLGPVALAYELAQVETFASPPRVKAGARAAGRAGAGGAAEGAPRWPVANFPVRRVTEGARALGFANMVPDADGVVRRAAPMARLGDGTRGEPAARARLRAGRGPGRRGPRAGGGARAAARGGRDLPDRLPRRGSRTRPTRAWRPRRCLAGRGRAIRAARSLPRRVPPSEGRSSSTA